MTESGPPSASDHPLVRLALGLVMQPAPAEPALTDAGREQLRAALRACVERNEGRAAALALLELAYFLAEAGRAPDAADAIGAVVAAEAGEDLAALAAEWHGSTERSSAAAKRLLGTEPPAQAPQASQHKSGLGSLIAARRWERK